MILKDVISHVRDRNYLSEIDRNYLRVKATGEVFTPLTVITKKLNDLESYDPNIFKDVTKTFLEPSCGDGNFLSEVLIRKIENGSTFEQALSTIYGVDLMQDNVDLCRERLLCGQEQFRHIVEQNIQCRDALKFGYNFKPMGPARRETEDKARAKQQRLRVKQEKIAKLEEAKKKKEAQQKKLFGEIIPEFV
jgi:hypothetical protein